MPAGNFNRQAIFAQDTLVTNMDPKFSYLVPRFFPQVKQFDGEYIEYDIVEGGVRIAPFASPMSRGKSTRDRGYRTYQLKPAYIKLLDTVRPTSGFVRRPGEAYGGSLSPEERLNRAVAEKMVLHREMIETRWEQMASEALFTGKLTIVDDDYPRSVVDFERDANLTITVATLWSNAGAADPVTDVIAAADKVNTSSRGAVVNSLLMRGATWDAMSKVTKVRDLVDTTKNLSPGTKGLELGGRNADKAPQWRGKLSGVYDIWTYDGYYENDLGVAVPFVPAAKVLLSADSSVEGVRYHGAIIDMDAGMQALELFVKTRKLWNPSGEEVLSQSAPMLGMRRPNATAVLTVL